MGLRAFGGVILKDLRIFSRPKFPALVILLAPLLIILLVGFVFNSSSLSGVVVGVYSDSYTGLTEEILSDFEAQNFAVNKLTSQQECIDSVKLSQTQICVVFPSDLSETGSSSDVVFYADQSRLNLAYTLIHNVEEKISLRASSLGVALAQDLIDTLNTAKETLPQQNEKISGSLNDVSEISENTENTFSSDINDSIESLESAKSLLEEDSAALSDIEDAIEKLNSVNNKISADFSSIENQTQEINSQLNEVSSDLDSLLGKIDSVNVLEAEKIVSPIKTKIEPISIDSKNRDYLIPTIISLLALFGGVLLSSTLVLKEKKSKAFFRNFTTPTWGFTFMMGMFITCLAILVIQFALTFLGIQYILKMPIFNVILNLTPVILLVLSVFIFLGMFIGYLFRSEETTIFAAVLISATLMFFSNTIIPIETTSTAFNQFVGYNPVVVSEIAFKKIILFGFDLQSVVPEIYVLASFLGIFLLLSYISRKATRRMF